MHNSSTVTHHEFNSAASGGRAFQHGAGAEPGAGDFAGAGAEGRAGGSGRGRKSGYAPKVIDMLCDSIRRLGLSDSAAAEIQGMGASTLSRWKRLYPEIGLKLRQARLQCREYQLEKLYKHAEADNLRGMRATQWILERLYPADYARKISDRFEAMNLEEILRTREESEGLREQLREEEAERKEQAAQARAEVEAAEQARARAAQAEAIPSERVLHNLHNSGEDVAGEGGVPVNPRGARPQTPPPSETEFRSTGHSQTGVWERAVSREAVSREGAPSHANPSAAHAQADAPAEGAESDAASEDAFHNCRNSRAAEPAGQQPTGSAIGVAPAPYRFPASVTDCHNLQNGPAMRMSANARGAAEYLRKNAARFGFGGDE